MATGKEPGDTPTRPPVEGPLPTNQVNPTGEEFAHHAVATNVVHVANDKRAGPRGSSSFAERALCRRTAAAEGPHAGRGDGLSVRPRTFRVVRVG